MTFIAARAHPPGRYPCCCLVSPCACGARGAIGDVAGACVAMWAAFWVRINVPVPFTRDLLAASKLTDATAGARAAAPGAGSALDFFGSHDPPAPRPDSELSRRLTPTVTLAMAAFATYLFLGGRTFPRSAVLLWESSLPPALGLAGLPAAVLSPSTAAGGGGRQRGARARDRRIGRQPPLEWSGGGRSPADPRRGGRRRRNGPRRAVSDLPRLLADGTVDDIILTSSPDSWQTRLIDALAGLDDPATAPTSYSARPVRSTTHALPLASGTCR